MPSYEYSCATCARRFEIFQHIHDYEVLERCPYCDGPRPTRIFSTQEAFVKLATSEIKTLGHLAHRNSEEKSPDEIASIKHRNTEYRRAPKPELPPGMTRYEP